MHSGWTMYSHILLENSYGVCMQSNYWLELRKELLLEHHLSSQNSVNSFQLKWIASVDISSLSFQLLSKGFLDYLLFEITQTRSVHICLIRFYAMPQIWRLIDNILFKQNVDWLIIYSWIAIIFKERIWNL